VKPPEQRPSYGHLAQPSPTIAQCLNGGYGWLEVQCHRCRTRASLPLDAIRRPRALEIGSGAEMPIMQEWSISATCAHD
jgi:hypothetical protein